MVYGKYLGRNEEKPSSTCVLATSDAPEHMLARSSLGVFSGARAQVLS